MNRTEFISQKSNNFVSFSRSNVGRDDTMILFFSFYLSMKGSKTPAFINVIEAKILLSVSFVLILFEFLSKHSYIKRSNTLNEHTMNMYAHNQPTHEKDRQRRKKRRQAADVCSKNTAHAHIWNTQH